MDDLLEGYKKLVRVAKAQREDPEHFPELPEFVNFCEINRKIHWRYFFSYLKKDYEKTSQEFKEACKNYSNIASNFDLTPYSGGSNDSYIGMISAFPFLIGPINGGIGDSYLELKKLIKAEKKLLKFEEQEGIRRLNDYDKAEIMDEYHRKVKEYLDQHPDNEFEKQFEEELEK